MICVSPQGPTNCIIIGEYMSFILNETFPSSLAILIARLNLSPETLQIYDSSWFHS